VSQDPAHKALDAAASPDAGEAHGVVRHGAEDGGHATHHLPPPSLVPINAALALAITFVGFLGDIRRVVGPAMWIIGLVWLIAACAAWVRASRREYLELPEEAHH
jgi:hypothetical protein